MEIERIHYLTPQGHSEQRTCIMLNDNSFSQSTLPKPDTEVLDKFSPSKAMLVGDFSMRALAYDKKLVVPPKKRKRIHEELELCDASTVQNLQNSELTEEDLTYHQKLRQENMCTSPSSASEKGLTETEIELNLQSSVYVKADDSAEWIKLKCFESFTVDGSKSATFFAGGPIQSSAFSIMPNDGEVNQYIALAAGSVINNKHSCNDTKNVSGIIQFWNVGSLHERKTLNQLPSMDLALYHDNGIITQMKWCPADCYDKHPSTCHFPRLGLLALSSTNSYVYIYNVPQPDSMPKLKPTLPIYFTLPSMKLIPLFGGPSFVTRKVAATCIEWEKNGERIVAGYANGAICMWMIKGLPFTSSLAVKNAGQPHIIQPYLFFQASGASITSLSFAPFNNHRWLVVSSIDKVIRFFDLHDTSAPFHVVKQGLENNCIWSDAFCGVYSSPAVNSIGLISLSVKDCCAETNEKGPQKGPFDSSTHIAVSEKKNLHAVADMSGAVTVNFLKKIDKPLETSYLTYMISETEIRTLDGIDQELKSLKCKISITGSIPSNDTSDTRDTFCTRVKQGSLSSSSGFCSPNFGKTIVIETNQCFGNDAINLLDSPAKSSSMYDFKDINDNRIKTSLNDPLCYSDEGTDDEMIKSSQSSEDLMHHLLMVKISNQSKSSSHLLPFNTSNNSAYCDSKGANHLSDKALITSLASSNSDTIVYPIEPCFCDTSHPNEQSESLNVEGNTVNSTTMLKKNAEPALKPELCTESNSNFFSAIKSGNSHPNENSSSKNRCELISGRCNLNYESGNFKKSNLFNCDLNSCNLNENQFTLTHSDFPREECHVSMESLKEIMKNGENVPQNPDSKGDFIFKKDAIPPSLCKNFDNPLCNALESSNLNQSKPLRDMCLSIASNNFIICDKDNQRVPDRALNQSSAASDYSGDTIIYFPESHDCIKTDEDYLKILEPGATFQSLYNSKKVNTFQDSFLHKMDEKVVTHGSETKLTENCSSAREKCEHFLTKESLKYNSGYGTNSSSQGFNSDDEDRIFFPGNFLISDFQLLHSEYLTEKSEEKNTRLNEDPQELSYENLIANFGVIFKDNLDESANPLKCQGNDIYIEYNPLSMTKTITWDPNEGCQSWLFTGGNSGIGRLLYVPDFVANKNKKPQHIQKRSVY